MRSSRRLASLASRLPPTRRRIASFLAARTRPRIVFGTYQSSPRIAEACQLGLSRFDLVVADEAHRCAGPEAGDFATVLDDARLPARRRLFMTATPRIFTVRRVHSGPQNQRAPIADPTDFLVARKSLTATAASPPAGYASTSKNTRRRRSSMSSCWSRASEFLPRS